MKNKYNAGDNVIMIEEKTQADFLSYRVSNETIESVVLYKDKVDYYSESGDMEIPEKYLYTKEEAMEFLKGALDG